MLNVPIISGLYHYQCNFHLCRDCYPHLGHLNIRSSSGSRGLKTPFIQLHPSYVQIHFSCHFMVSWSISFSSSNYLMAFFLQLHLKLLRPMKFTLCWHHYWLRLILMINCLMRVKHLAKNRPRRGWRFRQCNTQWPYYSIHSDHSLLGSFALSICHSIKTNQENHFQGHSIHWY